MKKVGWFLFGLLAVVMVDELRAAAFTAGQFAAGSQASVLEEGTNGIPPCCH
jgi:hypothetical protein